MTRMKPSVKIPQFTRWDVDKFWNNNNFVFNEQTACWEWQRYLDPRGYGKVSFMGALLNVHRLAYAIYYGEDPGELLVRHKCHNPKCANPFHLELGTHDDNSKDMVRAGRTQTGEQHWSRRMPERFDELREMFRENGRRLSAELNGENHPTTVLTAEMVREIKRRSTEGVGNRELAKEFGVTHSNISAILLGKSWKHIEGAVRSQDNKFGQKLTPKDVRTIREHYANGHTKASLARAWKMSESSIFKVVNRISFKYVE